jgi:20S proteasome alpha/beta subunit
MTVLIGLLCEDGIVIGADSSATLGTSLNIPTIEQKCKKIHVIENRVIVAGTGSIGLCQRFTHIVGEYWKAGGFEKPYQEVGRDLSAQGIQNFRSSGAPQGQFGALAAYSTERKLYLCEFAVSDFQPEFKDNALWYTSMGSGQLITDPFLGFLREIFWKDKLPSLSEGIFYVVWALWHTIKLNPGGINEPIQTATLSLTKDGYMATLLDENTLGEHVNNVIGINQYIASYKEILQGKNPQRIPEKAL